MFAARSLQSRCLKTLSSLILNGPFKDVLFSRDVPAKYWPSNVIRSSLAGQNVCLSSVKLLNCFDGSRAMSTSKGRSMRSKVERRMQKESGKTLREIRRAKKLRKKLMTDEERLIYNIRRAKKKVALLLQKLKKYELPELPPPRHDPELLTPEQLQAYKKIGFRNKNYVPVGVRGVFGGVVQNMHLHWKFHETVQVCCDNFPKEKIKEMASMLARLSGGIVVNVHNVKTIIMFRGRNYRQPKNLIPLNTLTKRKALFKARFEQALESQKLNIKKIEQQLRRMGVNPDDPVAMASIQRVASTFFNAIDKKEGSPYVFREDKQSEAEPSSKLQQSEPAEDSDQEELDRFIAEIEDAADKEWAEEEAAEKEEISRIRYWNRENLGGRYRRSEVLRGEDSDDENAHGGRRSDDGDYEDNISDDDEEHSGRVGDASDYDTDVNDHGRVPNKFEVPKVERGKRNVLGRANANEGFRRIPEAKFSEKLLKEDSGSDMLSDVEAAMWQTDSEDEQDQGQTTARTHYRSSSDEDEQT
ncbi:CRM-domain containing factor CFM9, mitochondrial [Diospyros lotus]|uniref:CRM-domain containing factor CFM9, mitochondrial n=1 Tax=Diospyros lotus TaxID=55363 RepID=UPI00225B98BC|nr:CRM-domain containing factor CFM9, mitochondrial [Diospyros lotus]